MNYNEVVYNSIDDHCQQHDEYSLDETPPPLPPRTHSLLPMVGTHSLLPMAGSGADGSLRLNLIGSGSQGKPLPKIPASVSFNDDLYAPDNDKTNKDALNNFINNERSADTSMTHRPLPPLPPHSSLGRIHRKSDSDGNEYSENDSDGVEDEEEENVSDTNDNDAATERQRNSDKHSHQPPQPSNLTTSNESSEQDSMKVNGIEAGSSEPAR